MSNVQVAYADSHRTGSTTYSTLYVCLRCPEGCDTCEDSTPCLARYNWTLRSV